MSLKQWKESQVEQRRLVNGEGRGRHRFEISYIEAVAEVL